jgi:hypothetical protein
MFKNLLRCNVVARRASRIAFGGVLIVGAAVLITSTFCGDTNELAILGQTWLSALAAAAVVRVTMARRPDRDGLASPGLVVPAVGLALLGPLSVHALVFLATSSPREAARPFHEWVAMSVALTALAHGAFAVLSARRALALVRGRPAMSAGKIWGWVVGVSCVPSVIVVIPPLIVGVTGLVFWPVLARMKVIVERERAELERVGSLPLAVARRG